MTYRHFKDITSAENCLAGTEAYPIFQKLLTTKEKQVVHSTIIEPMYEDETQFEELYRLVLLQLLPDNSVRYYRGDDFTVVEIDQHVHTSYASLVRSWLGGPIPSRTLEALLNNPKDDLEYFSELFHLLLLDTKKRMFRSMDNTPFTFGAYHFDGDHVADITIQRSQNGKAEFHVLFHFKELFEM